MAQYGRRRPISCVTLAAALLAITGSIIMPSESWGDDTVAQPERTRFLVLDARIIDEINDARLTVGKVEKHPRNPLFKEDRPWEPRFDNLYANILFDEQGQRYKCWYSPFIVDERTTFTPLEKRKAVRYLEAQPNAREMGVCYAVSTDGLAWEKPDLGLVEFNGTEKNNIVVRGPHGAGVFKDLREPDPSKRYKMFFKAGTMSVAYSADGLHWSEAVACPGIDVKGDTHNNAFWAPELGKYVGITRMWNRETHVRQVGRTESADFVHWTKAEVVLEGLEGHLQTYAMPVFRHAGVYLGLPVIFNTKTDRTQTELTWSADTIEWRRIDPGTALIPNAQEEGAYDWGCVYGAAYPVFLEDEIRIYYGGSNGPHTNWRDGFLCLATLRPDGFAGYEPTAEDTPAVVTTKSMPCQGATLRISADVREGGSVTLSIVDANGADLLQSKPITQTVTDGTVEWEGGTRSPATSADDIRLKFTLRNARLYSFSFAD